MELTYSDILFLIGKKNLTIGSFFCLLIVNINFNIRVGGMML